MAKYPVSGIINSLPIDKMIAAPFIAAIDAQSVSVQKTAEFIDKVGLNEDGTVRMVPFAYKEQLHDANGDLTGAPVDRVISVPLIAITDIPRFTMQKASVDFELEVNTMEEDKSASEKEGSFDAEGKVGWGPFSLKVRAHGKVSSHHEQTRKTDTRSKYSIHVEAGQTEQPEALSRVLDVLLDATTKPLPAGKQEPKPNPAPNLDTK